MVADKGQPAQGGARWKVYAAAAVVLVAVVTGLLVSRDETIPVAERIAKVELETGTYQYKFVAVLHEESAALHPSWRSRFLAPSISYVPAGRDARTEIRDRTDRALARAGVL